MFPHVDVLNRYAIPVFFELHFWAWQDTHCKDKVVVALASCLLLLTLSRRGVFSP